MQTKLIKSGAAALIALARVANTLRHLKLRQLYYFLVRRVIKLPYRLTRQIGTLNPAFNLLDDAGHQACHENKRLVFLNTPAPFLIQNVNWQPRAMSKLWRYNLHYFDYLLTPCANDEPCNGLNTTDKNWLIQSWLEQNPYPAEDAWEPYPTSLRIINWIKYFKQLGAHSIPPPWHQSLYQQGHYLTHHIEWHIDANHLLKNILALIIWSHYFSDAFARQWQLRSLDLLKQICQEQFYSDGSHYERSPMYHFILVQHLLDVYNCLINTTGAAPSWLKELLKRALNYCCTIVKPDGRIPLIKDSAFGIAPSLSEIQDYASRLNIWPQEHNPQLLKGALTACGYFLVKSHQDYILFDVGNISPSHQPGHAHCDALHLEVYWNGRDIFTDTGVFNYVASPERDFARSVRAHNTACINSGEQHEIWGAFRIAKRGHIQNVRHNENSCSAEFYPYFSHNRNISHKRSIKLTTETSIDICEYFTGRESAQIEIYWHLAPGLSPHFTQNDNYHSIEIRDEQKSALAVIKLQHNQVISIFTQSDYFPEFGQRCSRHCIILQINDAQLPLQLDYQIIKM